MDRDNIPCVHVGTPVETSVEIAVEGGVLRSSGVRSERRSGCYAGLAKGAG